MLDLLFGTRRFSALLRYRAPPTAPDAQTAIWPGNRVQLYAFN